MIESFGISDIGKKRQNNEDAFAILQDPYFCVLADGMGGHLAGEIAARLATDTLCQYIKEDGKLQHLNSPEQLMLRLSHAIQAANQLVHKASSSRHEWCGMGTTLSCLLVHDNHLFFGHVGDSRIYLLRDRLKQLTQDHVVHCDNKKGKITKAIGTFASLEPEIGMISPICGDLLLLCSDGLTDHLSDLTIEHLLRNFSGNLPLLCQTLVDAANLCGGHDNITVLAMKII